MTVSNLHAQITDHMTPASCFTVHDIEGLRALPVGTELTDDYSESFVVIDGERLEDAEGDTYGFNYFDIEYPFVVENAALLGQEVEPAPTLSDFAAGDQVIVDFDRHHEPEFHLYDGPGVVLEVTEHYVVVEADHMPGGRGCFTPNELTLVAEVLLALGQ